MKYKIYLFISLFLLISCNNNSNGIPSHIYPDLNNKIQYQVDWQKKFYDKRIKEFKASPIGYNQIVLLGNSITEDAKGWNDSIGITNITNRGISGDITDGILVRLDEIIYFKPLAVFLLVGINDIYAMNLPEGKQTEKHIINNIIKILEKIRKKSPQTKLYLQTILPTHREDIKNQIKRINSEIINIVQPEVTVIDLYSIFANSNDLMTSEYTTDGVHLNSYGYGIWINQIRNHINKYSIKKEIVIDPDSISLDPDTTDIIPDSTNSF
jgi:lysophospholipase L1-like esterase